MIPRVTLPRLSDHGSEIVLLGILGGGVLVILGMAAWRGQLGGEHALDVAAFLLVLQRIVEAVQKRWEQRGTDRLGEMVAQSQPAAGAPAGTPEDPISVKEAGQ